MYLFFSLILLLSIAGVFLFPFLVLWWVERGTAKRPVKKHDRFLYRQLEQILRRAKTREEAVLQTERFMEQHGYTLSRKTDTTIIFRPASFFTRKTSIRIDVSAYPTIRQRLNTLKIHAESSVGLLTKIAKADGKISRAEANLITQTINRFIVMARQQGADTGILSDLRASLVRVHKEAKENTRTVTSYAKPMQNMPRHTKTRLLQQLLKTAILDGFSPYKEQLIFDAGLAMDVDIRYIRQLIGNRSQQKYRQKNRQQRHTHTTKKTAYVPEHYRILGCTPADDTATIKKTYRGLVRKYHPDFAHSQITDDASKAYLLQKIQEINLAYEKVKKERKM